MLLELSQVRRRIALAESLEDRHISLGGGVSLIGHAVGGGDELGSDGTRLAAHLEALDHGLAVDHGEVNQTSNELDVSLQRGWDGVARSTANDHLT